MNEKLVNAMADLDEDVVLSEVNAQKENGTPVLDIIANLQEEVGITRYRKEYSN
ncbi:hypothetical protein CLRAG_19450 [Clostridium ragsdalei P11]|uniref:Uncharacterized protein n=1 Tax=Clostridium ragsdalei P11 TaxID=1353534 RepID=A0A1A6AU82_9CLOT|nr:hypothetical protein [Clostridium ragsdalei]OBR93646.1 hypothetical protein CLRAG_19450 [Clostridium ragsdalei P11]